MKKKKSKVLLSNTVSSFAVQFAAILSSFIVPKCILTAFGSVTNGTVTSITSFLGFIALMEAGVGNVSRSALFKPVAEKDTDKISLVVNETHAYFQKVAFVYSVFVIVFAVIFPVTIDNGESYLFNLLLVFVIALANLFQYYFGAGYLQVLWADQKVWLLNVIQTGAYLLNIVLTVFLVTGGMGIHVVKLASSFVFLIRPLTVNLYVKRKYHINTRAKSETPVLTQKWNNLLQTIAYFVHSKTDVIVLTYLSTLATVSVYSVYAMITTGLSSVINSLCNGFTAKVGNLYGAGKQEQLRETFDVYEHFVYNVTFVVFTTAGIMVLDFIRIYTANLSDADYHQPLFAFIIVLAEATYCIRLPYSNMISVAGHFKETQIAAVIEAVSNILISVFMVHRYGLVGISVGTFIAMLYRTSYQVHYLSKKILVRPWTLAFFKLLKFCPIPVTSWAISIFLRNFVVPQNYIQWVIKACVTCGYVLVISATINFIFFKKLTVKCVANFLGKI